MAGGGITIKVSGLREAIDKAKDAAGAISNDAIMDIMEEAAKPLLLIVKEKTPAAEEVVRRYDSAGRIAAVYEIGNLSKSMKIFRGTGLQPKIYIGPQTGRSRSGSGDLLEDDGWYAFFIIHGTINIQPNDFMSAAEKIGGDIVKRVSEQDLKKLIEDKLIKAVND